MMNAQLRLEDEYIQIFDVDLKNVLAKLFNDIKNNFPELIKTDQEWSNLQDKNIFNSFKKRYNQYKFSDAFILFTCINYDVNRLKNILNSNNDIINIMFCEDDSKIRELSFRYLLNSIYDIDSLWYFDSLNNYINTRIIMPAYSVLIPYWINIMHKFSDNMQTYINVYIQCYINYYVEKISNIYMYYKNNSNLILLFNENDLFIYPPRIASNFDKKYIYSMKNSILHVQELIENYFIQHPRYETLFLLLRTSVKRINECITTHIINFLKEYRCSQIIYKTILIKCILNNEQKIFINSLMVLDAL